MQICILGKDKRNNYLKLFYQESISDMEQAEVIITPIPLSKDGVYVTGESLKWEDFISYVRLKKKTLITGGITEEMKKELEGVCYHNIMEQEDLTWYNAIPTVEGAIQIALEQTEFTLHGASIGILGFGRIGKLLAHRLSGFGAKIYCEARKEKDIAFIEAMGYNSIRLEALDYFLPNMDIIFNTIPYLILDGEKLKKVSKDCLIIDLASRPGGVDFKEAEKLERKVLWELGLPARVAPKTAALYLKEAIDKIIC